MKPRILINTLLVAGILALAVFGAVVMIRLRTAPEPSEPVRSVVRVLAPRIAARKDYPMVIEGFGSTRAAVSVQIVPEVLGKVVWRSPDAFSGRFVTKGQELFRIELKDYELAKQLAAYRVTLLAAQAASLDQEERNLKDTEKIEAERVRLTAKILTDTRTLLAGGAAADSDVDQAEEAHLAGKSRYQNVVSQLALIPSRRLQIQADHKMAQVQLDQATVNHGRTTYASPVAGRIRTWEVPADQVLQAGRTYGEIYATDTMEVPVPVEATDLKWLDRPAVTHGRQPTEKEKTVVVAWHGKRGDRKEWRGYVDRTEAGLTARTRTAVLVVRVDNAAGDQADALDINMFCRVEVSGRKVASVFVIPRSAVDPDGHVYVVVDGKLRRRAVKVVRFTGDDALVLPGQGLAEGDRLVTSYLAKPIVGMSVTPIDAPASRPASRPGAQR